MSDNTQDGVITNLDLELNSADQTLTPSELVIVSTITELRSSESDVIQIATEKVSQAKWTIVHFPTFKRNGRDLNNAAVLRNAGQKVIFVVEESALILTNKEKSKLLNFIGMVVETNPLSVCFLTNGQTGFESVLNLLPSPNIHISRDLKESVQWLSRNGQPQDNQTQTINEA